MPNAGTVTTSLYSHVWHNCVRLKNILLTQNKCSHLVVAEEAIITAIEPGPDRTIDESLSLEFLNVRFRIVRSSEYENKVVMVAFKDPPWLLGLETISAAERLRNEQGEFAFAEQVGGRPSLAGIFLPAAKARPHWPIRSAFTFDMIPKATNTFTQAAWLSSPLTGKLHPAAMFEQALTIARRGETGAIAKTTQSSVFRMIR
jgi:hypothetical protein